MKDETKKRLNEAKTETDAYVKRLKDKQTIAIRKTIDGEIRTLIKSPKLTMSDVMKHQLLALQDAAHTGRVLFKHEQSMLKLLLEHVEKMDSLEKTKHRTFEFIGITKEEKLHKDKENDRREKEDKEE